MVAKLDPLDPKKLGDAERLDIEVNPKNKCEHVLEQVTSDQVECIKCRMGLFIALGDRVKDGHLYHHDKLIV